MSVVVTSLLLGRRGDPDVHIRALTLQRCQGSEILHGEDEGHGDPDFGTAIVECTILQHLITITEDTRKH